MGAARSDAPRSVTSMRPFKDQALEYFAAGWLPMPLPAKRKEPPPSGVTGWKANKKITQPLVRKWHSSAKERSNIAHCPQDGGYIGIDVDLYKGDAPAQWAAIIEDIGELPDTWTSSAQADGSGIRHYRLPEEYDGMHWPGTVGDAIQFCHVGHRYPVLPPSVHPKGGSYYWYKPGVSPDGESFTTEEFPAFDELPYLPAEVIEYFTKGSFARFLPEKNLGPKSKATKIVAAWIEEHDGEPCAKMLRAYEEIADGFESAAAHDTMSEGFYRLACLAAEGHAGLSEITTRLHDDFGIEVRREGRAGSVRGAAEAEEEWLRSRDMGVKKVLARIDEGDFYGYSCTCPALDAEGNPRPVFNVANYDIVDSLERCYRALSACEANSWNGAYNRTGKVLLRTKYGLVEANADNLRTAVARATEWVRPGGDGPPQKANPPEPLLRSLLVDPELNTLPGLRYLTRSPFWALVDGKPELVHENGYHAGSQVILDMDPELALAVANVDGDDFSFGMNKIKYMFKDFPFASGSDRANVCAALLLPYVRELIDGPTPLHLVHAPSPGSGKSLLCESVSRVVCGMALQDRFSTTLPGGKDADAETKKLIVTGLKEGPRVFIWDNVVGEVKSKDLAQVLTEPIYNARHLGTDDGLRLPNACLWLMNGNQFKAIEDIRRRIVPIELRAHTPKKTFDMKAFLETNRKYIVWALLSMVRAWVDAGMPLWTERTLASYERYCEVIGGVLAVNGMEGFLGNLAAFNEQTTGDSDEYLELIEEWAGPGSALELGEWYRVGDILNGLQSAGEWVDSSRPGASKQFGAILSSMKNRPLGENGEFLLQFKRPGNRPHYCLTAKGKAKMVKRGGARRRVT